MSLEIICLTVQLSLTCVFIGFMLGEINAIRREAKHQRGLRNIRNGGRYEDA